jgi:hypothetical protein
MIKQFTENAILTTQNPECFLNFAYEAPDPSLWIVPEVVTGLGKYLVNGIDVQSASVGYALHLSDQDFRASFLIYTSHLEDFDSSLHFRIYNNAACTTLVDVKSVNIYNRQFQITSDQINSLVNQNILIDDEASYLVLRTNPKFSGNIKLIVDVSENLFLDTFQISDILNNKKYRKQQVSGNSVYSGDVRNVFSSLPKGELYRVSVNDALNIAVPKTDLFNQYDTTYNYGARLLMDDLYTEDNGVLAPLWINQTLPDFFALFRLPGTFNPETYAVTPDLTNLAFKYLEESELIKSWSLKKGSTLGTYLDHHLSDITSNPAPVFLSLPDTSILFGDSDPNTWYGVAIDKGIVTGRSETQYFFEQNQQNFAQLNQFISSGFERNNLVCSNLINLQYIFDDNDVSLYSMSRYFGFYLTENPLYKFAYYMDTSTSDLMFLSLDGKDSSLFIDSSILWDASGNVTAEFSNRIFTLNGGDSLIRIKNINPFITDDETIQDFINKPGVNLFDVAVKKEKINPFATIKLNTQLHGGDHIRVLNKTTGKIWEAYGAPTDPYKYVAKHTTPEYPILYQTSFNTALDIEGQIHSLYDAFDLFSSYPDCPFHVETRGSDWFSIILNDDASFGDDWKIQRITSQTRQQPNDENSVFNTSASPSDVNFFRFFTPDASDFLTISYDASYGPITFELYGDRRSIEVNFVNSSDNILWSFVSDDKILQKFQNYMLYQETNGRYRLIKKFDINSHEFNLVRDPLTPDDRVLIMTPSDIALFHGNWNAYAAFPMYFSLMGINPVKDIDYTVYDSSLGAVSEYVYKREGDASTWFVNLAPKETHTIDFRGSFEVLSGDGSILTNGLFIPYNASTKFNTFNNDRTIIANNPTVLGFTTVLDGSTVFTSYDPSVKEENLEDYYVNNKLLKYPLTTPIISSWVGLGTDCRNNLLRFILDASIFAPDPSGVSNFLPTVNNYIDEISYPVYKYLTPGTRNWQDYVFYDINDAVLSQDGSTYITVKQLMFNEPYLDVFSKLVYSNDNVDDTKVRSTILYYNQYKNSVDTIFLGLNLSLKVRDTARNSLNIKNYDKYRFSFISTASKNRDNSRPVEVIINENTQTILMIWYQGNDILNYSYRNSSILPGKALLNDSSANIDMKAFMTGKDVSTYSFVKTPFIVNNAATSLAILNLYNQHPVGDYPASMANPYSQFNYSPTIFSTVWNAFTDGNTILFDVMSVPRSYNTFNQVVSYDYARNALTYGEHVMNYGYKYNTNENFYRNGTCTYEDLVYFLSANHDKVFYYIISGDTVLNNYDFRVPPFTVLINDPRNYKGLKTFNGWFKPKFDNILGFTVDEHKDLMDIVKTDFMMCNTNLRVSNNIDQLWYNKVVTSVTDADVVNGNAIQFKPSFNTFESLWDAGYYTLGDSTPIDGYNSGTELPSFFGSKLIKLPNEFPIDSWDPTVASYTETDTEINFSFNLTVALQNMFKVNYDFIQNWSAFSNADDAINSYVKNIILQYYNIGIGKLDTTLYSKPFDGTLLHYTNNGDFTPDEAINVDAVMSVENNEYIYNITVKKTGNLSYYAKFILTEK